MQDPQQCVIRILNLQGRTVGAGFVISDRLAVSCAHVIRDAGGDCDQSIQIQFFANEQKQTVLVLGSGWFPPNADDVAFLQLEYLPEGVVPAVLGSVKECSEHSYLSFGFAKLAGYDSRWASGTLEGTVPVPDGHKQPMLQLKGEEIKGGMSGAPILDVETRRIVGMVSEYKDDDRSRIAWATSSDTLLDLASPLLPDHPALHLWSKAYGPEELNIYLQHLITTNEMLFLPDGREVLLERIYVSLRADEMNAVERKAEHNLYLEDVAMVQKLANVTGKDQYAEFDAIRRAIIRQPIMFRLKTRNWSRRFDKREQSSLSLAEVEKRHRYVVVLGDPGSGKTTLGKWLVLQFARALLQGKTFVQVHADLIQPGARADKPIDLGPARLPIFIRIADYARARWDKEHVDSGLSFEQFISQYRGPKNLPLDLHPDAVSAMIKDYLKPGRALVVLDGLDEVSDPNQRRMVMQTVKKFIQAQSSELPKNNEWAGNRLLLTSRIVGYQFDPLTDLPHYTVEDMDEIAISSFCRAWMTHVAEVNEAEKQGQKLKDAIFHHGHPGVRTLAGNPLLLTILAQVYWTSDSRSLPTRRISLFDSAVQAFYNQRGDIWRRAGITLPLLIRALGAVASHMHAHERTGFAEEGTVRAQLMDVLSDWDKVEMVLEAAREVSGFLVERGEGVYGFLHRAVQEYFAAKHLADHPSQVSHHLVERLLDPTWREPIILAVGVVSQPRYPNSSRCLTEVFDTVLDTPDPAGDFLPRRELLAVAACMECERVPEQAGRRIAERLLTLYARREGNLRSPVLRKRIHDAFITLREHATRAQAETALCDALLAADFELRYAAIDTVIETKWDSVSVAQALVKAWSQYADPAVSLLTALDEMIKRSPSSFQAEFLPLRQAVTANPLLWEKASISLQWKAIFRVLYLPLGAYFKSDRINRDSPLTPFLLEMLRQPLDRSVFRKLRHRLVSLARQPGTALARDAALALSALGDSSWIQKSIENGDSQRRQIKPIVACLALALNLEQALVSNDLDDILNQSLICARSFNYYCDEIAASRQSLQDLKTRIRALGPLANKASSRIRTRVDGFIHDPTLTGTHAYDLAVTLKKDLDLISEHLQECVSVVAVAFDPDFPAQIERNREVYQLLNDMRTSNKNRSYKSKRINALAFALGLSLPLAIKQARELIKAAIRSKKTKVDKFKYICKLVRTFQHIDNLGQILEYLIPSFEPGFLLDAKRLKDTIRLLNYALNGNSKGLTPTSASQRELAKDLLRKLRFQSQRERARDLLRKLISLSGLMSPYIEALQHAQANPDQQTATIARAYVENVRPQLEILNMQVIYESDILGIVLPINWKYAYDIISRRLDQMEQSLAMDLLDVAVGNELISLLDRMSFLTQQHRELALLPASNKDIAAYETELASASARARALASAIGLVLPFDIDRALEQTVKHEQHLYLSRSRSLARLPDLEIEFDLDRILSRVHDSLNEFELALSQELVLRRPTGTPGLERDFARVQELNQLRIHARKHRSRLKHLQAIVHEKAKDLAQVLDMAEKQAHELVQRFERALRSDIELSSEIDLAGVRRLDLTLDLDFALHLARPSTSVNEIIHSIYERQNVLDNNDEVKLYHERALASAENVQRIFVTATPIAQVMSTFVEIYGTRWSIEAESSVILSEPVELSLDGIKDLVDDLASNNDIRRERTMAVLGVKRRASDVGRSVIERIAEFIDRYADNPHIATQLIWTLEAIIHDQPSWVNEWVEHIMESFFTENARIIIESVHHVTAKTCVVIVDALPKSCPDANRPLLRSLNWLIRLKQVSRGKLPTLREKLFSWLASEADQDIRCSIIDILGHWPEDSDSVGLMLLRWLDHPVTKADRPPLYKAVAGLAVRRPNLTEKVKKKLRMVCSDVDAAAALLRLTVARSKGKSDSVRQKELDSTRNVLSRVSSDTSHYLKALLKAGIDDEIWDNEYHDALVNAMREELERQINQSPDQNLLTDLLTQFEQTLQGRDWPLRRFILAVVAACTEVMPIAVQHACNGRLEDLLVKATTDAESFNSRRFALTALSYLRTVTPAVVPALLAGCHDTEDVQHDTITAASRFQSIEGDLLPVLMKEINGESVSRAYTITHLLSALGGSAASEISSQRDQIIEAVVEALKNEASQREVLVSGEPKGKLEDALYTTLLRVAGWMG